MGNPSSSGSPRRRSSDRRSRRSGPRLDDHGSQEPFRGLTADDLVQISSSLFEEIDTPRSLACHLLLRAGEFEQLFSLTLDPAHYLYDRGNGLRQSRGFLLDFQATDFCRKLKAALPGGPDLRSRREAAIGKFCQQEAVNLATNQRLSAYRYHPERSADALRFHPVITRAKKKIRSVLGHFRLSEYVESCGFGPGVSDTVRGAHVASYNKFLGRPSFTQEAESVVALFMEQCPLWALASTGIAADGAFVPLGCFAEWNTLTTVPKTSLIDRVICIEPNWNIFLQKGLGLMIRRRLKRHGIDLDDQSVNSRLAREGSRTGDIFTLDLSAASDSVTTSLVSLLFEDERVWLDEGQANLSTSPWFDLMNRTRCKQTRLPDGTVLLNQKFSSMGNGFTFELESLIFWVVAASLCEERGYDSSKVSVYGDDITGPRELYDELVELLDFLGFSANKRKSFNTGPFRESCGGNYFKGVEVTPARATDISALINVYSLHNQLLSRGWRETAAFIVSRLRKRRRMVLFGPCDIVGGDNHSDELGDNVLRTDDITLWVRRPSRHLKDGWCYYTSRVAALHFAPSRSRMENYEASVLHSLRLVGSETPSLGYYTLRKVGRWSVRQQVVSI